MSNVPVIVTTEHGGVFFGYIPEDADISARSFGLERARMAIYWGTTRGLMQLAETGPTEKSQISDRADIPMLHDITAVFGVTDAACAAWEAK